MVTIIICGIFGAVLIISDIIHYAERRELYRYIKADSIKEVDCKGHPPKSGPSGHVKAIKKWRNGGDEE